jgi:hypothetical protein
VTVGSNSNVAENGMDKKINRAAIREVDPRRELPHLCLGSTQS